MIELLQDLLAPLEISLLVTALLITRTNSIKQVIVVYRLQCVLLALVTGLTVVIRGAEGGTDVIAFIFFIMLLPLLLAFVIKPLLARASIAGSSLKLALSQNETREAERTWRSNDIAPSKSLRDTVWVIIIIGVAVLVAFQFNSPQFHEQIGLMVSLSLHLIGLYNMIFKRDLISQVVGLLIMDQGLYLAVVKIVEIPIPAALFVVSLYFYTLITLFILVFLLPQVRHSTGTTDLSKIAQDSSLEG
jgi:hydrogenase-4 membrane subunit HyfE